MDDEDLSSILCGKRVYVKPVVDVKRVVDGGHGISGYEL
jgi:hypothetical protein